MITTQLIALDIIHGAGGNPIPPPIAEPQGGGSRKYQRRYVKLRDGRQIELESEYDLERVLRQIIAERQAGPAKKAKPSRKIRPRVKPVERLKSQIEEIADWSGVYQQIQMLNAQIITEQAFLAFLRQAIESEQADDEENSIMMLLM